MDKKQYSFNRSIGMQDEIYELLQDSVPSDGGNTITYVSIAPNTTTNTTFVTRVNLTPKTAELMQTYKSTETFFLLENHGLNNEFLYSCITGYI